MPMKRYEKMPVPVNNPGNTPKKTGPLLDSIEVQKIMEKLREADRNKDGSYSKDELKNALKDLGAIFPGWRANRCLGKADANNDGEISGDEIDTLLHYLLSCGYGN